MKVSLIISLSSILIYAVILIVFIIKIKKAEKNLPDGSTVKNAGTSFWAVFAVALILILLPVLIPLETYLIVIVCACGILGEFIVLRDRLQLLNKTIEENTPGVELPPED